MAAAYQFASICCCGHCNLVIFNRISSKFHIWFASNKSWFNLEYEFCRTNYNQDGYQMAAAYQFTSVQCCGHSNLVIISLIFFPIFIYELLLSNSGSSLNMSFVRPTMAKMADKWPPPTSLHSWTPTLVSYLSQLP